MHYKIIDGFGITFLLKWYKITRYCCGYCSIISNVTFLDCSSMSWSSFIMFLVAYSCFITSFSWFFTYPCIFSYIDLYFRPTPCTHILWFITSLSLFSFIHSFHLRFSWLTLILCSWASSMHCIMGTRVQYLIIEYLCLVFLLFLLPHHPESTLWYVSKTTLRPWKQISSSTTSTWVGLSFIRRLTQLCFFFKEIH